MMVESSSAVMKKYLSQLCLEEAIPEKVWPLIELCYYLPEEYLCRAGDRAEHFCLILEGRGKVIPTSEDGKTVLLSYLPPLDFLGDIELLNDCAFLHSVQAEEHTVAINIPRHVFLKDMMQNVAFLQFLCRRLANKIYMSSQKHSSAMLYPIKSRLERYIISQTEAAGRYEIIFKTDEAAQYLGITSRHLRRVLSDIEAEGLIQRSGMKVIVIDMDRLKNQASYY